MTPDTTAAWMTAALLAARRAPHSAEAGEWSTRAHLPEPGDDQRTCARLALDAAEHAHRTHPATIARAEVQRQRDDLTRLLVEAGCTASQIAAELGVHPATVGRWLDRLGIEATRGKRGPRSAGRDDTIHVCVSRQEREQIQTWAQECGVSVSEWVRSRCLA